MLFCLLLSGCYDSVEIDDLAYVVAVGVDKGEHKPYKITFQYAVPLNISPDGGGEGKPLTFLSFETESIQTAVSYADSKMAKITDLSHLNLIVFSEDISKDGIMQLKADLYASVKTAPDALMAVCKGDALKCLESVSSPLELNPSRFYDDFFESAVSSPYAVKEPALGFFNGKTDFALPVLAVSDSVSNGGMAAFKNGKLVTLFSLEETLIYNILKGSFTDLLIETEKGIFSIDSELSPKYSIETKEKPHIKIKLSLSGEARTGTEEILKNPKSANENLTSSLKKQILLFLQKTKEINCDILTLSSHAKRKFLTDRDFEKYRWEEKYRDAEFEVTVVFKNTKNSHGGNL